MQLIFLLSCLLPDKVLCSAMTFTLTLPRVMIFGSLDEGTQNINIDYLLSFGAYSTQSVCPPKNIKRRILFYNVLMVKNITN